MATEYGIVKNDGTIVNAGSGGWTSSHPATGQYLVTFDGVASAISSQPVPVVTAVSGDLSVTSAGSRHVFTISESGTDVNGRWYFAVAVRGPGGAPADKGFAFVANG